MRIPIFLAMLVIAYIYCAIDNPNLFLHLQFTHLVGTFELVLKVFSIHTYLLVSLMMHNMHIHVQEVIRENERNTKELIHEYGEEAHVVVMTLIEMNGSGNSVLFTNVWIKEV